MDILGTGYKNEIRVLRGGSWNNNDNNCRSSNRNNNNPDNSNNNNGFRFLNTINCQSAILRNCRDREKSKPVPARKGE